MGYVDGYDYDYFLSYAHIDDEAVPGTDKEKGWVSLFFDALNHELRVLSGGSICSPWKDGKIPLHKQLEGELDEAVGRAAVLVVLLSPSYVNSAWCRREREEFCASRNNGPAFIIAVERMPVEESALAPDLRKNLRYRFYDEKTNRYFGHPLPKSVSDPFFEKVRDLSEYVKKALDELRTPPPPPPPPPGPPGSGFSEPSTPPFVPPPLRTVFVAQVGADLEDEYNSVRKFLKQYGVTVRPDADYPQDPEGFRSAAAADLKGAAVFVQLLSGKRGTRSAGLERGYPTLQFELAKERGDSLTILQWRDPTLKITEGIDPDSRALLEKPTVRAQSLLSFQEAILEALEPKTPVVEPPGPLVVVVNGDEADRSLSERIGTLLMKHGAIAMLRAINEDPKAVVEDLKESMNASHGMILVYGDTPDLWVRAQMRFYWTWRGETARSLPTGIIEGPPLQKKAKLSFFANDVKIFDCRDNEPGRLEGAVHEFIQRIRAMPSYRGVTA